MYVSLTEWIKVTFSQDSPILEQNELTNEEIEQLMASRRILEPDRAWRMRNSGDDRYDVDNDTARVSIEMRDMNGGYLNYGHGYVYWFHPDNFDVLVNDVVVEEHLYVFYPVHLGLDFYAPVATDAEVVIRGHIMPQRALMEKVAQQWLVKIGMVVDVKSAEFDRLVRRFNNVMNRLYGARMIRRSH
jgi:hypothetical protein